METVVKWRGPGHLWEGRVGWCAKLGLHRHPPSSGPLMREWRYTAMTSIVFTGQWWVLLWSDTEICWCSLLLFFVLIFLLATYFGVIFSLKQCSQYNTSLFKYTFCFLSFKSRIFELDFLALMQHFFYFWLVFQTKISYRSLTSGLHKLRMIISFAMKWQSYNFVFIKHHIPLPSLWCRKWMA